MVPVWDYVAPLWIQPMGTVLKWTNLREDLVFLLPVKFCCNLFGSFGEVENVKSLQTGNEQ